MIPYLLLLATTAFVSSAPVPDVKSANISYSDDFARNIMLPLAAAAYSNAPGLCISKLFPLSGTTNQVTCRCDLFSSDTCSGYAAILNEEKAIVLSFRGTDAFLQLITESNESILEEKVAWPSGGKVSKYFYNAFWSVWTNGMKDEFLGLMNAHPTYQVWVTGHSLGGAMASLAASYIIQSGLVEPQNVFLYTFGQPRTGNHKFATGHDNQNMNSFRVTHWRDVVPHVPPEGMEKYHHHLSEVFYNSGMAPGSPYKVCSSREEDSKCSDGLLFTLSVSDHLHYFEKNISEYGISGCQ